MQHAARLVTVLIWCNVAATVVGFFLPWASMDVHEPKLMKQLRQTGPLHDSVKGLAHHVGRIAVKIRKGTETIAGDLPSLADMPHRVSGVQIPQLANQQNAQVAVAAIELLTNARQHIGPKSYAVYLVPGLALVCGILLTVLGHRTPVDIGAAVLCAIVAGAGFWKLLTTNTQTLFIAVTIGPGLWLSLWAYVGLALCGVMLLAIRKLTA